MDNTLIYGILDERVEDDGETSVLVQFIVYTPNQWVPESLINYDELIEEFRRSRVSLFIHKL